MKIIFVICFILLTGLFVYGNTNGDSTKAKSKNEAIKKVHDIGYNDSTFGNKKKKRDVFVDKDGDGICDNRAKGMSFEKFRKRYKGKANDKGGHGYQGGQK